VDDAGKAVGASVGVLAPGREIAWHARITTVIAANRRVELLDLNVFIVTSF
jgi:hypothetical protein